MTRRSSLMEWLDQTRRLSKSKDMVCLEVVDDVLEMLPYLDKEMLLRHQEFFDDICTRYHKTSPITLLKKDPEKYFKENHDGLGFKQWRKKKLTAPKCLGVSKVEKCPLADTLSQGLDQFVEGSIRRSETALKDILWQWFEVIDFMYERPELINPDLIDEYVTERIYYVCKAHKKNNPLANGMRGRFGRFYKNDKGEWCPERRKRF